MWNHPPYWKDGDVESGPQALYPTMLESPELRWAFIRKIYAILTFQMLLTVAVAAAVVSVRPISHFFVSSGTGLGFYIFLIILPFIGQV
ncbi:protein LIFEGUARD 4-like [Phoenix dactylifera]|uniref:Protein LIFEGUARD 4-like n=1 Tax=Phoenix dactylifera TaxID=42345 RepID=A0A8B8ZKS3_PHODC|nr:protein LIFEGUARD 4-like [Phoenix dactylifera]